jgi:hypothetical protein
MRTYLLLRPSRCGRFVFLHTYVCMYACVMYVCMYALYIHTCVMYVCMYALYIHTYTHKYVCIYVCMCVYTYVCMYVRMYMDLRQRVAYLLVDRGHSIELKTERHKVSKVNISQYSIEVTLFRRYARALTIRIFLPAQKLAGHCSAL